MSSEVQAVDIKLVFKDTEPEDVQEPLREALTKILSVHGIDVFLRNPSEDRWDLVTE